MNGTSTDIFSLMGLADNVGDQAHPDSSPGTCPLPGLVCMVQQPAFTHMHASCRCTASPTSGSLSRQHAATCHLAPLSGEPGRNSPALVCVCPGRHPLTVVLCCLATAGIMTLTVHMGLTNC
jgi:hypothetical protein